MKPTQAASVVPAIVGYADRFSTQPGDRLAFKVSSMGGLPFRANVVRIHCADPNPAGPGLKMEKVDFGLRDSYSGAEQPVHMGSCAIGTLGGLSNGQELVIELTLQPTLRSNTMQTLMALQTSDAADGLALALRNGELMIRRLGPAPGPETIETGAEIRMDAWTRLQVTFRRNGKTTITTAKVGSRESASNALLIRETQAYGLIDGIDTVCLGAVWRGHPEDVFEGLMEAPSILVPDSDKAGASSLRPIAMWDFSQTMRLQSVPNSVGTSGGLTLVNLPQRAVRSSLWSGLNMDWKTAPGEYAAIRFHSDDLSDCKWDTSLELSVPSDAASGVYGLVVENNRGNDTIPFYITPASGGPRARIVFLAPTLTYLAYANHARGNFEGGLERRVKAWGAYPHNADVVTAYGASTYNNHRDGSGISISSRLRPILTMRPGYLTFDDPRGSGLRHFSADSHITDWLREKGFAFDVITDEDLDEQGKAALEGYDVVITGSHPEYYTRNMMEAMLDFRTGGGSLMYMGGNGFYWKIARSEDAPHALEIRRAEGGMRMWASEPGEYYNQFDGEYGGMWRRNGLAPQAIAGVGFAVEGDFVGSPYLRTPESFQPEFEWLFEGVSTHSPTEGIGDFGLSGGGAAGFELDQAAYDLGTPEYVSVVAVSNGHDPSFKHMPEELLTWDLLTGKPRKYGGICANMVCGISPKGGGIFASGSICFAGSLSHNNYVNNVSRIVENFLRRFV